MIGSDVTSTTCPVTVMFCASILQQQNMIRIKLISLILFIICKFKYDSKFILVYSSTLKITTSHAGTVTSRLVLAVLSMPLHNSFSLYFIEAGCDYKTVSVLLGHSNISTTLDLYVHPNMEQKKRCIAKVFRCV